MLHLMSMSSNAATIADVKKTAFDFERSDALTKLFIDVRKAALNFKRLNALTKLSVMSNDCIQC